MANFRSGRGLRIPGISGGGNRGNSQSRTRTRNNQQGRSNSQRNFLAAIPIIGPFLNNLTG